MYMLLMKGRIMVQGTVAINEIPPNVNILNWGKFLAPSRVSPETQFYFYSELLLIIMCT